MDANSKYLVCVPMFMATTVEPTQNYELEYLLCSDNVLTEHK